MTAFLVVAEDTLVMEDLRQTIEEYNPSAQVLTMNSLTDAAQALQSNGGRAPMEFAAAIIAVSAKAYVQSALATLLKGKSTLVALADDWDDFPDDGNDWVLLPVPFRTADIQKVLQRAVGPVL